MATFLHCLNFLQCQLPLTSKYSKINTPTYHFESFSPAMGISLAGKAWFKSYL